uniref:Uncharacterized protein n=1 Tax=viral metagenome TaxID=1070528 RepID=A0A6C0HTR6_9ZZZZ
MSNTRRNKKYRNKTKKHRSSHRRRISRMKKGGSISHLMCNAPICPSFFTNI